MPELAKIERIESNAEQDKLLTPTDVKEALQLRSQSNHVLRNYEKRGLLHPVRLGKRTLRYTPDDLRACIAAGKGVTS